MVELYDEFGDLVFDGFELRKEGVHCRRKGREYSVFKLIVMIYKVSISVSMLLQPGKR